MQHLSSYSFSKRSSNQLGNESKPVFASKEEILKQNCQIHKIHKCDLLHMNGSVTKHRVCILCAQKTNIPLSEILPIQELLEADSDTFFSAYPVFNNPDLNNQIEKAIESVEDIRVSIENYFSDLRQSIIDAIDQAKTRAQVKLKQLSESQKELIETYKGISKIEDLQEAMAINDDDLIHEQIQKCCQQSTENTEIITKSVERFKKVQETFKIDDLQAIKGLLLDKIEGIKFIGEGDNGDEGNEDIKNIIKPKVTIIDNNIPTQKQTNSRKKTPVQSKESKKVPAAQQVQQQNQEISPLKIPSLLSELNIVPSIYYSDSANKLTITKESTGSTLITFTGKEADAQCFVDMELERDQRYVLRLGIIHNNMRDTKNFGFKVGLIQSSLKSTTDVYDQQMSYSECSKGIGINKLVKGTQLHSSKSSKSKRLLEFRIHLGQRFLRAANLPDYSSVVELDDSNKIKEAEKYYVAIFIGWPGDQVRVLEMFKVAQFDRRMD